MISVVVCTRNRVDKLRRCITAFERIKTQHPWELIVVDNGSTDGTGDFLQSIACVRYVRQTKIGLSQARNAGVQAAQGEIIAFTDDDCYVTPDYINALFEAFSDQRIGFVGGQIRLHDPTDLPITVREGGEYVFFHPYTFLSAAAVQGANMAFRKYVLHMIGGFDERFGAGSRTGFACDDTVALATAIWRGVSGVYDPRIIVFHHHGRKTKEAARSLWKTYDAGRGAYYAKFIAHANSRKSYIKGWTQQIIKAFNEGGFSLHNILVVIRQTGREGIAALRYATSCGLNYHSLADQEHA